MNTNTKRFFNVFFIILLFVFIVGCGDNNNNNTEPIVDNTYTIMFNGNGGTLVSGNEIQKVTKPSEIIAPVYEKDGFTFKGFDKNIASLTSDAIVNVLWESNKYIITFKNYDGTILSTNDVNYGEVPSYVGTPQRPNTAEYSYTFIGWSPIVTEVTKDAIYVAQYSENVNKYTVTFKDWDGTILQSTIVNGGETPSYNKSNPTRNKDDNYSYKFNDWAPQISVVTEDIVYTATYIQQLLPYNVTVDLDGGTSSTTKLQFRTDVVTKDLLPFDVKKKGYAFKGYELNGVKVYDEDGNTINNYQASDNMVFKAIYEESVTLTVYYTLYNPKTYELINTYIDRPNDICNASETRSYNYNTYVDLFAYPDEGYTFVGWYNEGQALSNEKDYKYMMWDEDFAIEARFKYTTYQLSVRSNNNDLGQVMIREGISQIFYNQQTLNKYYTEVVTIVAYSKTDTRRFLGWYNENNELVSTNAVYTFNMINRNYTLEAKWDYFKVTYDLDEGTNNSNNPTYYTVDMQNITLLEPTKEGYTFIGWEYNGNIITEIDTSNICHMALKALWTYYTLTTNINNANVGTISQYNNVKITKGELVTITATAPLDGYTFNGWYDGDKLVSSELTYIFNMPNTNLFYTAIFAANTNTPYKVEHYLQNIENDNYTLYETDNLTGTTDTQTTGSVKTYDGFTSPTITQVNINGNGETIIKLYYIRNTYTVTLNNDNNKAGQISESGTYKYGQEVTITATPNLGYTFNGWYNGEELISSDESYTFNMLATNLVYKAVFIANTNTPYKVEHHQQNIYNNEYILYETDNLTGTTDTLTNGQVKTYDGFTSPTITQVNINGNGETIIKLYYIRNTYTVTLNNDNNKAGQISESGTYKYGQEVTITATPNLGYTFNGWYNGEELISSDESYTFIMPPSSINYTAKWTLNKYTITLDNQADGVIISGITSGEEYEYGTTITLTATNIPVGYTIKWVRSDGIEYNGDSYSFNVPSKNITITTTTLPPYTRNGNKIYFGTYPQTLVTDKELKSELNALAGSANKYNWTDYNYYISSYITSYMFYKDIDKDNDGSYDYRGVYFTQYRPYYYSNSSSTDYSYQDNNGYFTNTIYWFSYDPIEWDILEEKDGKALIIANLILDSQEYYPSDSLSKFTHNGGYGYANNYKLSNIRKFLNDNFYNTAFNDLQKSIIETTLVDNSLSSTGDSSNNYVCNNTNDKLFLLSRQEATTYYTSDASRQAKGTDYAKAQGLYIYNGNSFWWLRSPYVYAYGAYGVSNDGGNIKDVNVCCANVGIHPACWINLK